MPVHLRAFVVVLILSIATLWMLRRLVSDETINTSDYKNRAAIWIWLTLTFFLAHSYWLFLTLAAPALIAGFKRDSRPFSLYCFLLFVVPPFQVPLPGLGVFNSILSIDHFRVLSLLILLPILITNIRRGKLHQPGSRWATACIVGYAALSVALTIPHVSLTSAARAAAWISLDVLLPFFVASRALKSIDDIGDALSSIVLAIALMAPMALFEFGMRWLLYNTMPEILGAGYWGMNNYQLRGDQILRASVTTGHPIILGLLFAVGIGLAAPISKICPSRSKWNLLLLTLAAGLIAAMSRGPWVGAAAMLVVLVVTSPNLGATLWKVTALGAACLPILLTKQGEKIISYLPFVGSVESDNVEFRQRLFTVSMEVFWQSPWIGAANYITNPLMEQMRGNDGIIDMVNCYVTVALGSGAIGLLLFIAPYPLTMIPLTKSAFFSKDRTDDVSTCSRALLCASVALLITMATCAFILATAVIYYLLAGIACATLEVSRQQRLKPAVR